MRSQQNIILKLVLYVYNMAVIDLEFIKNFVLRFFAIYRLGNRREYDIATLKELMIQLYPEFSYNSFEADLLNALTELVNQSLLLVKDARIPNTMNMTSGYSITDLGNTNALSINDDILNDCILETHKRDLVGLNMCIKKFQPFERLQDYQLTKRMENVRGETEKPRRDILFDSDSVNRYFDILNTDGFIKEYERRNYKFTKRGRKLIEIGSLDGFQIWEENEKIKEINRQLSNDTLVESNIANVGITRRLYVTNLLIAVATVFAAAYYILEMVRIHIPDYLPLSVISLIFFVGACLGASLWYILPLIDKYIQEHKTK